MTSRPVVRVLGPLDVVTGTEPRDLGSARQREVLAALAVRSGQSVPIDALVESIWGDGAPPSAIHTVQGLVSRLRGVLGAGAVVVRSPGYVLVPDQVETDARQFEALTEEARAAARAGDIEGAVRRFDDALGLWRGAAYAEFADRPFAQAEAARLEELRAAAADDRTDALLATRPPAELVAELEAAAADDPYRERRQGQLMVALARAGQPVEALRSYERFRSRLADEVGVAPSRSLQDVNDDILRQAPGSGWEGPAIGSVSHTVPDRLPRPVTSFVGRGHELAVLADLLPRAGLVTVCGPGGVGKSRLALEAARRASVTDRWPDGVWWCDLTPVHPAADDRLVIAVAEAVGASSVHGVAPRELLESYLATRSLTLVLDNCEHVAVGVADLAAGVLQHAPDVRLLITSREPLAIAGEHLLDLGPLLNDEAVTLFVQRASAVRAGFELRLEDAGTVAGLCDRLDRIPLALELAAGRLRSVGIGDLDRMLDDRFRMLVSDRRDAPDRHRTLRATIASSYEALTGVEREAFERSAIFPGTFTLDAAAAVCSAAPDEAEHVVDVASRLVDHSMVVAAPQQDGLLRYRLLESLRVFGRERLDERGQDVVTGARRRHAEHFASLVADAATGITGPDEARWVTWLVTEMPNLREAIHWATEAGDLDLATSLFTPIPSWTWCGTARSEEIGRWASLAVEQPGIEDHPAYPAVCDWGCRTSNPKSADATAYWMRRITAPGFTPTACTLAFEAYAAMSSAPHAAAATFMRAADLARAGDDPFTEAAMLMPVVEGEIRLSAPTPTGQVLSQRLLAASRASGSPTSIVWALLSVVYVTGPVDRDAALGAIEEISAVLTRCAIVDPNIEHSVEYARGFLRLVDGDRAGLAPLRTEIAANAANGQRSMTTVHLLRLARALVHLEVRPEVTAELIAGVRSQGLVFSVWGGECADDLRSRLSDTAFDAASARGAALSLAQLVDRALTTIDELLPVD